MHIKKQSNKKQTKAKMKNVGETATCIMKENWKEHANLHTYEAICSETQLETITVKFNQNNRQETESSIISITYRKL